MSQLSVVSVAAIFTVAIASVLVTIRRSPRAPLHRRRTVVLFGDSLTQRGWAGGDNLATMSVDSGNSVEAGWASGISQYYTRHADVVVRGFGGAGLSCPL